MDIHGAARRETGICEKELMCDGMDYHSSAYGSLSSGGVQRSLLDDIGDGYHTRPN